MSTVSSPNSILSVIIAIVIALSSMCGGVANVGKPVSMELGLTVDGDFSALAQDGGSGAEYIEPLKGLISALSLRFAADESTAQMEILLNGDSAASLAMKAEDDGWSVVSTLFPNTALTVKNETIKQFTDMAMANNPMESIGDTGAIAEAFKTAFEQLLADYRATAGEPETGSFTVAGVEYTVKTPYNITTKEAAVKFMLTLKNVLSDERLAGLISMMGSDFSPEALDKEIENLNSQDESELPVLAAAEYANEAGDTCTEILLTQDDQAMSILVAKSGEVTTVNADILEQLVVSLVLDDAAQQYDLKGSFAYQGMAMTIDGSLKTTGDLNEFFLNVAIPLGETPVTLGVKGKISSDAPVYEAAEGLNVVSIESLAQDEEAANAFIGEFQGGLFTLLGNVMSQYPELGALMNGAQ